MLWAVALIYHCGRKWEHYEWSGWRFCSFPLLSTVYQYDGCLSYLGCGGSCLGCQVLPAFSAVSILELAANSGSSRMSRAPNLHRVSECEEVVYTHIFYCADY